MGYLDAVVIVLAAVLAVMSTVVLMILVYVTIRILLKDEE